MQDNKDFLDLPGSECAAKLASFFWILKVSRCFLSALLSPTHTHGQLRAVLANAQVASLARHFGGKALEDLQTCQPCRGYTEALSARHLNDAQENPGSEDERKRTRLQLTIGQLRCPLHDSGGCDIAALANPC